MNITKESRAVCLAIIRIFETSRAAGDYAAYAVLDDGAGVSYGTGQFTHRSGSLQALIEKYLAEGGVIGRKVFDESMPLLRRRDPAAIETLARNRAFESALKAASISHEMRSAQNAVGSELYLRPATDACDKLGLRLPLSLAVVFDSSVHGSWEKIRGFVKVAPPADGGDEKAWVTAYVRKRHAWLTASPRLAKTAYRTRFFLDQIAQGRWQLELPLRVNGVLLTRSLLNSATAADDSAAEPAINPSEILPGEMPAKTENTSEAPTTDGDSAVPYQHTQPPNTDQQVRTIDIVEDAVYSAARRYDRVDAVVRTVITRKDAAKSLWTTVVASLWQLVWAVTGFVCGIPRPIWLAAALIMGALAAIYLYRQITLGKIRERADLNI